MKVINHIAAKYENIKKGIGEIMGGKVLDYEAKRIYNAGRNEGWNAGRNEGLNAGRNEGKLETYISLIKDCVLTITEAAKRLGMTEDELKTLM